MEWKNKCWNYNNIKYELKNGKGFFIEVMNDNSSLFEGEYINGLKKCHGREYDYFGEL